MRIGELSKMYGGIDKRTIDFYTSKGLLVGKPGKNSKYRDYDQDDVERLGKILIFREMGLSINDIEAALNDDSYWTPARLDQHIAMLKENQAREYERYEQMIQFAQTMKDMGMSPLGHFKGAGIQADKYAAFWVKAYQSISTLWETDHNEDIAQLDDMLNTFFSRMADRVGEAHDSAAVQSLVERLANRLSNAIGAILYMSFSQIVASDAVFAMFEGELNEDGDLDEEDVAEIKAVMSDVFLLIADWCRTAKTKERICDSDAMQLGLTEPLQKLCEKYDDDTFFTLDDIKDILTEMLGGMTSSSLLETFIAPMTHSSFLNEITPGLANFIREAINYYASTHNDGSNDY